MTCIQATPLFSPYLDGAVTGKQMRDLSHHLEGCERCRRHYAALRRTQDLLARVGRRKAPSDLALKVRVAISQETAHSRRRYLDGLRVRFDNALDLFMVPATAGLAAAVVIFVVLMGFLAPLQADNSDVPLLLHTAPQLQQSAFGSTLDSINDDSLVIDRPRVRGQQSKKSHDLQLMCSGQFPIEPAAPSVHFRPRFRALALFGRRPPAAHRAARSAVIPVTAHHAARSAVIPVRPIMPRDPPSSRSRPIMPRDPPSSRSWPVMPRCPPSRRSK